MSEGDLRRLLANLDADLDPPPDMARKAWAAADASRLHRRVLVGAGAMAAAAAVPVLFALGPPNVTDGAAQMARPNGQRASTMPVQPAPVAPKVRVYKAAPPHAEGRLELMRTPYARLGEPRGATPLSAMPVRRVVAATQADRDHAIHLLGDDGTWRVLDTSVAPTSDGAGATGFTALKTTSISPDARRLAIPQPQELVVVDVTVGGREAVRRFRVPGFNELVRWSTDGRRVMVGGNDGTFLVDVRSGALTRVGYRAWDVIGLDGDGARELGSAGLRVLDAAGNEVSGRPPSPAVERWWSDGWERSGRVARAAVTSAEHLGGDEGIAVLDGKTGQVTHFLGLGMDSGRSLAATRVLGWADDRTVLIGQSGHAVLAWDYPSGTLRRVAQVRAQAVALAPTT